MIKILNVLYRIVKLPLFILIRCQSRYLKNTGLNVFLGLSTKIIGHKYIEVSNNVRVGDNSIITAWASHNNKKFSPELIIGEGTTIGEYAHITCINRVILEENVMIGKFVTISDNSHGYMSFENLKELSKNPKDRDLFSKGPVIIGKNVWIGDKVSILANVTIGESSIIGANSVVTKNVPPFCIYAGNPAKKIKDLR